jgi:HrpA-like RNA helicase
MTLSSEPEIRRCSLTSSFLQLKCLGLDMDELDFMDKPDLDSGLSTAAMIFLLELTMDWQFIHL